MRHLFCATIFLFLIALWTPPAIAQVVPTSVIALTPEESLWLKANPAVTIGLDTGNAPISFRETSGELVGLSVDYLNLLSSKSGLKIRLWGSGSRDNVVLRAQKHELDGVISIPVVEAEKDALQLTVPYTDIPFAVAIRKTDPPVKALQDFDEKRIAVVQTTSRASVVRDVCPKAQIIKVVSPVSGLKALREDSADAFFDDLPMLHQALVKDTSSTLKIALLYSFPRMGNQYIALSNPSPQLCSIINKAITEITEDEHRAIRMKWFPRVDETTPVQVGQVLNETEAAWFKAHPLIRVGADISKMPLEWRDSAGRYQGVSFDYLHHVESALGIQFEIVPGTRDELLLKAKKREVDVFFFMPETEDRKQFLSFTRPYMTLPNAIFSTADVTYIHDLNQLNGKTVAVVDGSGVHKYLAEKWPSISLLLVKNTQDGVESVRRGEAFAFIGIQLTTTHKLIMSGKLDLRVVGNVSFSDEFRVAVRDDWPELVAILDKTIYAIPLEDRVAYQKKWVSVGYARGIEYTLLKWTLGAILLGGVFIFQLRIMVKRRTAELQAEVERRRLSEDALKHESTRYRTLLDTAIDGICILDMEGNLLECNDAFLRKLGYTREEARRLNVTDWDTFLSREKILAWMAQQSAHPALLETVHRDKTGRFINVEVNAAAVELEGKRASYCSVRDITERKRLSQQLIQSQKMESVGLLAGGVAHDFNNILAVILGRGELLLEDTPVDSPSCEDVTEIIRSAERARDLTRQLLAFSRKQVLEVKTVNLDDVVRDMQKMVRRLLGEHIQVEVITSSDGHCVNADISQLEQVIMNLCVNARDAMPNGGTISMKTKTVVLDENDLQSHPGIQPGPYVMLSVSDSGIGMDEETRRHIFDPFFTTKEKGVGTGLGLAMVYGIVKQHGGGIWVYSEVECGTTFKIYLPAVSCDLTCETSLKKTEVTLPAQGETVLVVEDDVSVRKLIVQILKRLGYSVLEASEVEESREIALTAERIDLLLTDVIMPGMNGRQVWEQISQIRPGIRTVFMSGYTEDVIALHGVLEPGIHFISKPFSEATLSRKLREALKHE
jgi:PAS domain S-box-containing protein